MTESSDEQLKTVDAVDASLISNGEDSEKQRTAESPMVLYKGALIDIEKLLYQKQRSEKACEQTELRLIELTKVNQEHEAKTAKAKDKIKDLQSELKSCNRKLGDAESSLSSVNVSELQFSVVESRIISVVLPFQKKCSEYHSILGSIHDKVTPIFVKVERNSSRCVHYGTFFIEIF